MSDDYSMPSLAPSDDGRPPESILGSNGSALAGDGVPDGGLPSPTASAQPEALAIDPAFLEQITKLAPETEIDLPLSMQIESLLFVAPGTVPVSQLAAALEVPAGRIEAALAELDEDYRSRGIRLQRSKDRVQLTSAPVMASRVERFLGLENTAHLTRAALETLAIIAYQQPLTRPQLDAVRGVNSDSVIKNLLAKGLIEEVGRTDGPGRPLLYGTTPEFLQHFGLSSLNDLPPLQMSVPTPVPATGNGDVLKE